MKKTRKITRKIKLTYAGLRIVGSDKVSHCFIHGTKCYYFTKVKWSVIGHRYEGTTDGEHVFLARFPEDLGPADIDEATLDKWREEEALAEQLRRTRRAAAKAKRIEPSLKALVKPIRERYRSYKTMEEREAFEKLIRRMLSA